MTSTRAGSAAMDEMRQQLTHLQSEIEKVSKENAERSASDASHFREYLEASIRVQTDTVNKAVDEKLESVIAMFEALMRDKGKDQWEPHNQNTFGNSRGSGVLGARPRGIGTENGLFGEGSKRAGDSASPRGMPPVYLPKMDFPSFDGTDPTDWVMKSEYFFEIYQTPDDYKTRLAVIHFVGEASSWYRNFRMGMENPPWELLVEEVLARFAENAAQELVGEFKRLHQSGKVNDYVKVFDGLKARMMHERPYLPIEFYVSSFIEGLREEIRSMVTMFNPKSLNEAYKYAKLYEGVTDTQIRRAKFIPKPVTVAGPVKRDNNEKASIGGGKFQKSWTSSNSYEQRRALNLCHKCNEKWHYGHQCANKTLHLLKGPEEEEDMSSEGEVWEENRDDEQFDEQVEEAVISLFNSKGNTRVKNMKFKGTIGKMPICALIDTGSTHSFVNPSVLHNQGFRISKNTPMAVVVANGNKMITEAVCNALTFSIQGHDFTQDMRILDVKGYDVILGLDWLNDMGPMWVDWNKGNIKFKRGSKDVNLQVCEEVAELRLCQGELDLNKEIKKGSELLVAYLFKSELEEKVITPVEPELGGILTDFSDVFQEPSTLPPHREVDHQIPLLPNTQPINQRPYRHSYFQKLEIEKIIEELLKNNFIQPSTSPFASPIILVKKKDNSWRLCIDYRKLNSCTVKNRYPIPIIEDLLDELNGAKIFSKIDLRSGYHQIKMDPNDSYKTAFRTHEGLYEYKVMPFGLTNAPATFQLLMNQVFKPFLRKFVLVFFDDILIYSHDMETHKQHLSLALELLRRNQLFAKESKCEFGLREIEYLGHVISEHGVSTDQKKVEAMQRWPTPKNVRELRGFLGLTGYYRRFIKGYGTISKPLTDQLKKNSFSWNEEAQHAFKKLKLAMMSAPVLTLPDFSKPFTVETDASDKGVGAVLMQGRRPVAFLSKSIGVKAQGLSTYEKEFLALLTAVKKWMHYLVGQQFIIKTDQISLKYLLEQRLTHTMQHKGLCKLLGLDYKVEYKKGKNNQAADALSRVVLQEEGNVVSEAKLQAVSEIVPRWVDELKQSYENDVWLEKTKERLDKREVDSTKYTWHQGLLRYKQRIYVGTSGQWRNKLMEEVHNSNLGGHSGVLVTYQRMKKMFYWPGLKESVHTHVRGCEVCQLTKGEHIATPGLLQPLPIPELAWNSVSMDFIGGLPKSEGREVILVIVDRLTKYAHFISLSHPYTASKVAQLFLENVYKLHGLPSNIVSDRDPLFTGIFWRELMVKLGVKLNFSTAYHPQSDGQTERVNQCLENYLRCMVYDKQKQWHRWLSLAEWWYNTSYHSALQCTPFQALYGYPPPQLPMGTPPKSQVEAVNELLKSRYQTLQELKQHLHKAQERMKRQADKKRSERKLQVGSWVYLKLHPYRQFNVSNMNNRKLSMKFYGPFEVIEKIGEVAYKLNLPQGSQIHPVFHISQLKPRVGEGQAVTPKLPLIAEKGSIADQPGSILDRKMVKKNNAAAVQVLIKWANQSVEDATWEDYEVLKAKYPQFVLRDKNSFKEGGVPALELGFSLVQDFKEEETVKNGWGLTERREFLLGDPITENEGSVTFNDSYERGEQQLKEGGPSG
ncbi:polyprotein [Rhynchospora pubera]|uniref:Polyprotein n=1 Tax=Rhynchospora pubera TaxID=906938 RepID=A0AAV8H3I0_9POAL|nr:polyprotein [Rhynchospora pubera]